MTLILFVCRGNTCRSPMAEVQARHVATAAGMKARFASVGIDVKQPDGPADPRAFACMAQLGLDLGPHRTRMVDKIVLQSADRVYALDRSILAHLSRISPPETQSRIQLLTSLVPDFGVVDIDDPWSGTPTDYERVFAVIRPAISALIENLAGSLPRT